MRLQFFKHARLALKSYSMAKEWDAGVSGNFKRMERWKDITTLFRRQSDFDDIQRDQYESLVHNLLLFPHDENGLNEALRKVLDYKGLPHDHAGKPITVEALRDYIDGLPKKERAELVPSFSQEQILYGERTAQRQAAELEKGLTTWGVKPNLD